MFNSFLRAAKCTKLSVGCISKAFAGRAFAGFEAEAELCGGAARSAGGAAASTAAGGAASGAASCRVFSLEINLKKLTYIVA